VVGVAGANPEASCEELVALARQALRAAETKAPKNAPTAARLAVSRLTKAYKRRVVVNDVALDLHQSEIVGLLGPTAPARPPRST